MSSQEFLFTSESVCTGHPDKICDQISDAILDACLERDGESRVACEALITSNFLILAGEITTKSEIDYAEISKKKIKDIGYVDRQWGFNPDSFEVKISIEKQSADIAKGLDLKNSLFKEQGAGDQGLMFGYACEDTPELMPLPIMLSHQLVRELYFQRIHNKIPFLGPDGKAQVTVVYDEHYHPKRVHTIVVSAQHASDADYETVVYEIKKMIQRTIPSKYLDARTNYYINPTGRFVIGGPMGDCGLTGRKTAVDTYGGMAHHGGGAFSGKDPSKVDRSGSYAARYIAKNIVAAKLATRCEIQLSYAIGVPFPISIRADTFGTAKVPEASLIKMIPKVFDLSPKGIIQMLDLKKTIYQKTAFGGHFGRENEGFSWEKKDKLEEILSIINYR